MQLSKTIGFRIALGFGLLIIAIIIYTVISSRILANFRQSHQYISNTLDPSIRSLTGLHNTVHLTRGLIQTLEPEGKTSQSPVVLQISSIMQNEIQDMNRRIRDLSTGWKQHDREMYERLFTYLSDSLIVKMNAYTAAFTSGLTDSVSTDLRFTDLILACNRSDDSISALITRLEQLASETNQKAGDEYHMGRIIILASGTGIALAAFIIAFFLFNSLVSQIKRYRNIIISMSQGILPGENLREGQDEMGQIGTALNSLIKGLKDLSDFSEEIGKGNFQSEFQPLSENDILGNSLIRLRKDLKNASIEDEKRKREDEGRNWSNQGIARFSEILREHTGDLQELTVNVIAELVKYLEASVGGIFLIQKEHDGKDVIELAASYAYDRQKYLKKKIMPGEGLVGRCIQEGSTIFLTDIPEDYIKIKSGLGENNPKSLLIVPLRLNEEVIGVIEIASLEVFQDFQIEFIERIGTGMASSIATSHSGTKK